MSISSALFCLTYPSGTVTSWQLTTDRTPALWRLVQRSRNYVTTRQHFARLHLVWLHSRWNCLTMSRWAKRMNWKLCVWSLVWHKSAQLICSLPPLHFSYHIKFTRCHFACYECCCLKILQRFIHHFLVLSVLKLLHYVRYCFTKHIHSLNFCNVCCEADKQSWKINVLYTGYFYR